MKFWQQVLDLSMRVLQREKRGEKLSWFIICLPVIGVVGLPLSEFPSEEDVFDTTFTILDTWQPETNLSDVELHLTEANRVTQDLLPDPSVRVETDLLPSPPLPPDLCPRFDVDNKSWYDDYSEALRLAKSDSLEKAAEQLEGIPLTARGGGIVPTARLRADAVKDQTVTEALALLAFHARYLAGRVAYRTSPPEAIRYFRGALNAVNYSRNLAEDARSHAVRTRMNLGDLSCNGSSRSGDDLTSLDAYAGLVAAYLAAKGFKETLGSEVTGLDLDVRDPMQPLVRYATEAGAGGAIPLNVRWAAVNLYRVYVNNGGGGVRERRLGAARASLTFRMLDDSSWYEALDLKEDRRCEMLSALDEGFRDQYSGIEDSGRRASQSRSATVRLHTARLDSVWAAAVVEARDRVLECNRSHGETITNGDLPEWLLGLAGEATRPVSLLEEWERILEDAWKRVRDEEDESKRGDARRVAIAAADSVLREAHDWGGDVWDRWVPAVFHDVANTLLVELAFFHSTDDERSKPYLRALLPAVKYAGQPRELIDRLKDEKMRDLRLQEGWLSFKYWLPGEPWWILSLPFFVLFPITFGWRLRIELRDWRYGLLTEKNFYAEEAAEVDRKQGGADRASSGSRGGP